ncbi:MAG: FG-GAP repeat protein [Planctomycetota bacterium]
MDGAFRFRNPGQQWSTQFDGRGFVTKPDQSTWSWGLELQSYGIGADQIIVGNKTNVSAEGQSVSYNWDNTLTEWYKNDTRGLEHGFTVKNRPTSTVGLLTLTLGVKGDLQPRVLPSGRDVAFVNKDGASVLNYSNLTVFDACGKTLPASFKSSANELCISVDDSGAHYPITIDPIAQQAYLKASNTDPGDGFGYAAAVSGGTVVIGAPFEQGAGGNQADNSEGDAGAVYVFARSGTTWSQQAYLKASNAAGGDQFGRSVSISGDTVVVGAYFEDSSATGVEGNQADNSLFDAGAAYVFVRNGSTWSQQAYLKASNTGEGDAFGFSVAISGDTVVVGAFNEDSSATGVNGNEAGNSMSSAGAAYVFVRSGTSWSQQAYLKASNTGATDMFGISVGVSGDTVVVGASSEDSSATGVNGNQTDNSAMGSGAAYVFVRTTGVWSQQAYLKGSNLGAGDAFGFPVSVSGDTVVVGALNEDSSATGVNGNQSDNSVINSGAAYVFVRSGTSWDQQAYLKASNTGAGDGFGASVSVSGDTVVVGARSEDSNGTGVNGDQSNNSVTTSGAAYVFVRSGTSWSQQAYLKASNTSPVAQFGLAVSVSGDTVVVGAWGESSSATGVNGNQADNSAVQSGAAYIFDLNYTGTPSYGVGSSGCAGAHTLGITQPPILNSPNFALTCTNAPPSSLGVALVSDVQDLAGSDPFFLGVLFYVDIITATEVISFDFVSDPFGNAVTVNSGIPNEPLIIGKTFYAMAMWVWTTCPLPPFNLSTSQALAITIQAP